MKYILKRVLLYCLILVSMSGVQVFGNNVSQIELLNDLVQIEKSSIRTLIPYEVYQETLNNKCENIEIEKKKYDMTGRGPARRGTEFMRERMHFQELMKHQDEPGLCDALAQSLYNLAEIQEAPHIKIPEITIQNLSDSTTIKSLYSRLAAFYVQFRLGLLQADGVLHTSDSDDLYDKIHFKYTRQCHSIYGDYTRKYDTDWELDYLTIQVNICNPEEYTSSFQDYIDQVLVHELGHHYYYVHDTEPEQFESLCWDGNSTDCQNNDFVTDYATTSGEEDYAETFLFVHQAAHKKHAFSPVQATQITHKQQSILGQKFNYFLKLYQGL